MGDKGRAYRGADSKIELAQDVIVALPSESRGVPLHVTDH